MAGHGRDDRGRHFQGGGGGGARTGRRGGGQAEAPTSPPSLVALRFDELAEDE